MKKRLFQKLFLLLFIFGLSLSLNIIGVQEASAAEARNSFSDPGYSFQTIDGTAISTKDSGGKTTVLIFGYTGCSKTRSTITSIAQSDWVSNEDYRVIFAEAQFAPQTEVWDYANKYAYAYGCYDISFCYDSMSDGIMKAVYEYRSRYSGSPQTSGSFPVVVLIDPDSQVQKVIMEGKALTADQLKQEIDQMSHPSTDPSVTPPGDDPSPQPGWADLSYSFQTIDNEYIPTTSKETLGKTTVLLFGKTTCGNTRSTLTDIARSSWAGNENIRVIFAEANGQNQAATTAYAEEIGRDKITYCYDEEIGTTSIYVAQFKYAALVQNENDTVSYPLTVLIDGNNRVREVLQGPQTAEALKAKIDQFSAGTDPVDPTPTTPVPASPTPTTPAQDTPTPTTPAQDTPTPTTPAQDTPTPTVPAQDTPTPTVPAQDTPTPTAPAPDQDQPESVPNVSGLKADSSQNSIRLSWNRISKAEGYLLYQYKNSAWKQIQSVKSGKTTSYDVKKLKTAANYRFAVKAYMTQDGKKITSRSYSAVYAATTPATVAFKASQKNRKVTLKWGKAAGADGYRISYKTGNKGSWQTLKNVKGVSFTSKKLKSGKTYSFTVKAYKTYKGKTYLGTGKTKKVTIK